MQVEEDHPLLERMLEDTRSAPAIYQPTNYWAVYEKRFLPELRRWGLRDFATRRNSVLSSFGGTDLFPDYGANLKGLFSCLNPLLNRVLPLRLPYDMRPDDIKRAVFDQVALLGEKWGARPLEALEIFPAGNPSDLVCRNGKAYPTSVLRYYLEYAYCCRFIDFDRVSILVELGSGAGRQAEVVKRLHHHVTLLLFDIPPQLYVAEQVLKAIFPGEVVSYRQTREITSLAGIARTGRGKIHILGNWQFPLLRELPFDLFWNSASFQEMEPDVAAHYLGVVDPQAESVYLHQMMGGKEVAPRKGRHGVLRRTTLEDYRRGLARHTLVDLSEGLLPFRRVSQGCYQASFWKWRSE